MPSPKKQAAAEGPAETSTQGTRAPVRPGKPWPATTVEVRPLASVVEYVRNARGHPETEILKLAASMAEFGWTMPLLVDEDGILVAGHARVAAARQLGWTEAPVMVARGWTPPQVAAYRLLDNRLPLDSFWDNEMLALEIEGLRLDGYDLALTGFSADELDLMSAVPDFAASDPRALWGEGGMPEYQHEDQTGFGKAIVHFATEEDQRAFEALVGQVIPANSHAIWFPKAERKTRADKRWVQGEPEWEEDGEGLDAGE